MSLLFSGNRGSENGLRQEHIGALLQKMIIMGWSLIVLTIFLPLRFAYDALLLGDSIDRQTVYEWCMLQFERQKALAASHTTKTRLNIQYEEWGTTSLKYISKHGRMATLYCKITYVSPDSMTSSPNSFSLAFVQMFGSPAYGPYLNQISNYSDPFADTIVRLSHALEVYNSTYHHFPDLISIQFASWDTQRYLRNSDNRQVVPGTETWKNILQEFRDNHHERIKQVQSLIAQHLLSQQSPSQPLPELILRTAAATIAGKELIFSFNQILEELAKEYHLRLFDYHEDIWSTIEHRYGERYERLLFRDFLHPKQFYTAVAGEKLLNLRYSGAWRSATASSSPSHHHYLGSPEYLGWKKRLAAMIRCPHCFQHTGGSSKTGATMIKANQTVQSSRSRRQLREATRMKRRLQQEGTKKREVEDDFLQHQTNDVIPFAQSVVLIGFLLPNHAHHHKHHIITTTPGGSSEHPPSRDLDHPPLSAYAKIFLYHQRNQSLHLLCSSRSSLEMPQQSQTLSSLKDCPILGAFRLGYLDILPISSEKDQQEILHHLPLGNPLSGFGTTSASQNTIFQVLSPLQNHDFTSPPSNDLIKEEEKAAWHGWYYHYESLLVRSIPNQQTLTILQRINNSQLIRLDPQHFDYIPPPRLFDETALPDFEKLGIKVGSAIQYSRERTVYALDQQYRRIVIPNMQALFQYVNDISEIRGLSSPEDLALFPLVG